MAIVTWPLSSGEARGRVGDLIYNTWRGRSYVKAYTLPQILFSDAQIAARAITTLCTTRWHAITDAQRNAWEAYAVGHPLPSWTGTPKRLTGYNWFIKLNWFCQARLAAINDDPPHVHHALLFDTLSFAWNGLDLIMDWFPQTPSFPSEWNADIWVEGPRARPWRPSIKRAYWYATSDENLGTANFTPYDYGCWTAHIRLVHASGQAMPFTHYSFEAT